MVLTFVWLDIIIPTCVSVSSGIGRTWTNVCGSHSSLVEGNPLQLFLPSNRQRNRPQAGTKLELESDDSTTNEDNRRGCQNCRKI